MSVRATNPLSLGVLSASLTVSAWQKITCGENWEDFSFFFFKASSFIKTS